MSGIMDDVAALQQPASQSGANLRRARLALGWSQTDLGNRIIRIRARRGLKPITEDSARQQISRFERGADPVWPSWRSLFAEALHSTQEQLFGLSIVTGLPQPLLHETVVTEDVVQQLRSQMALHASTEHIFGASYAQVLVDHDLATIDALIQVTPQPLYRDVRRVAALTAELGGWIAQDSGDQANAERLTAMAEDHARVADPRVRAMILMRRSNIVTGRDPKLGADLIAAAAELFDGNEDDGRLGASIARQEARTALATRDANAFREHSWYAAELATADPTADELAPYAAPAYVASETAAGLIALHEADEAVDLLQPFVEKWPDGQQRDHSVARARLLLALVEVGDYRVAVEQADDALHAYQAAPSARARTALRRTSRLLRDRARSDRTLHTEAARVRIANVLRGDESDG